MENNIKLYRVILNVLFYMFYVFLVSISFSFIFPTILVVIWKDVLSPKDPIFGSIQIVILIIVLIFSLVFRKYFYLPIRDKSVITKKIANENIRKEKVKEIKRDENSPELDIKIGKEIK